ncbi:MAG: hypothetical protein LQ337_003385 [Flavoplaca oasis]|nr:MAG: hypothetical protein LQ337_003385 [Flavoplaca oasis]
MLQESASKVETHDRAGPLLTAKRVVRIPSTPFNAAMIPLQFGLRQDEKIHPTATNPLPPLAIAPVQPSSADITLPSSRPPSQTILRSSRQSRDSGYKASISSSSAKIPSPRASNLFDPTPIHTPNTDIDIDETNIPTVSIAELIGDDIMSNLDTIPSNWTLTNMINHIIDNDIVLPTEDDIDGNRAANAAALPILETPAFYDEYESTLVDFARTNPGLRPVDDLQVNGRSIYSADPVTGRIGKLAREYNPVDPRHSVWRATVLERSR